MRKINGIVFHHSATSPPDSSDGQSLYLMSIDPVHLESRGILSKAEYHYIVARNGRLIRCANDFDLLGHCGSVRNNDTIGISCEGNFLFQKPTNRQYETLFKITATLVRQYAIRTNQLLRHKDVMATACPGLNFPYEKLQTDIREALQVKPDVYMFKAGSRDVILEFPDAQTYQVRKLISEQCTLRAGKARVPGKCLSALGLPVANDNSWVNLRDFEIEGYLVSYDKKTKEIVLSRRGNGR